MNSRCVERRCVSSVLAIAFCLICLLPIESAAIQWTGGGATTVWSDAGNWAGGEVPGATSVVELTGNASISLTGDCTASCITNTSGSPVTLTLAADSNVRLNASICGDISVVKNGAGTISFAARQSYTGLTRIVAGEIKAVPDLSFSDYKAYGTLSLHLDASHSETILTDANGYVTEWKSLTDNGITTYGAAVAHSAATLYTHESPFRTTDTRGRTAIQFGMKNDGPHTRTNTFISAANNGENVQFQARTFFLVQRQLYANTPSTAGLLGMINGYAFRFYRSNGYPYGWDVSNMDESWCNGRKRTGAADNTYTASGDYEANLLVVRNSNLGKFDIIGNQYLMKNATTPNEGANKSSNTMVLYEVLLFDEALEDDQIEDISALLMKKWNVPQQSVCLNDSLLPTESSFTVDAGAALDCGDTIQTLSEVSGAGTLRNTGLIDLNGGMMKVGGGMCVTGYGEITNTAAEKALLIVSNDTAATLAAHCGGNLDVEKQGSGTLWVSGGQKHSGEIRLNGGKIVAEPDFSSYGTLSVHLDASHSETIITDGNGVLTEWKSLTDNGMAAVGAAVAHAGARYTHESPFPVADSSGRTTVRFGYAHGVIPTTGTNTFLSARSSGADVQFSARTFFLVQRQHMATKKTYGFLGMITGAAFRFYRSGTYDNGWNTANMDESWCNGRKATSEADNTFVASGATKPNLLVVRRSELGTFDIIGNQYLMNGTTLVAGGNLSSIQMDLYEVLLYDEKLTDAQIDEISAFLMKKWNVPQQVAPELTFGGSFAPASTFTVLADSTLDFVSYAPQMAGLKTVAFPSSGFPVLTFVGDWDVTALPLAVEGSGRGTILRTTGSLTSPFASVTGWPSSNVKYTAQEAMLKSIGFVLSFR